MIHWCLFLILFPLIPACLLLLLRRENGRNLLVLAAAAVIAAASVGLVATGLGKGPGYFSLPAATDDAVLAGDLILALVFLFLCRRLPRRRWWIPALVVIQYGSVFFGHLTGRFPRSLHPLWCDNLSLIMSLVVGVVGALIAVYSPGYLRLYHRQHPGVPDRTGRFLSVIFLFFFAMFGVIFSDSLSWLYFFWEVTTLCSFLMIGYSRSPEAVESSFRALGLLLIGGLAMVFSLFGASLGCGTVELSGLLSAGKAAAALPVAFLCLAGMNKAAQFPFSSWLLGAMVAPTPASALLHSSAMVKAGVYLCIRLAPLLYRTTSGHLVALLGGLGFLAASALAVAQTDAKRGLAYSTVANLGLIVLCAGVGSHLALWAGILLIVFHAPAKALLFLCVGSVEQKTGSREIEGMRGLITRMPWLTVVMLVGMAGMYLPPFGMLISKWAVLEALALKNTVLTLLVIFGGALTLFFWAKWMGALVALTGGASGEETIAPSERIALVGLAALTVGICASFPWLGAALIEPMYGSDPLLSRGRIHVLSIMMALVILLPLGFFWHRRRLTPAVPYLSGVNRPEPDRFSAALQEEREWTLGGYYLPAYFGEARLFFPATLASLLLLAALVLTPLL